MSFSSTQKINKSAWGAASHIVQNPRRCSAPRLPKTNLDAYVESLEEPDRSFVAAFVAYYRGDSAPIIQLYHVMDDEYEYKYVAATMTMVAAIGMEDFALFDDAQGFFDNLLKDEEDETLRLVFSLPSAIVATSAAVKEMIPDWLASGDYSALPAALRPQLVQYYLMYLRSMDYTREMLGVAKTAYSLMSEPDSFTTCDVYYCLMGAHASYRCGDVSETREFLSKAINLALPHGFIVPFAEYVQSFGGILETLLQEQYPNYYKSITALWRTTWKGWMSFHKRYTQDNIAIVLTPQEHHVALLLSRGATYEETASRMHLSTGRIRNIASAIYGKLSVKNKRELRKFLL